MTPSASRISVPASCLQALQLSLGSRNDLSGTSRPASWRLPAAGTSLSWKSRKRSAGPVSCRKRWRYCLIATLPSWRSPRRSTDSFWMLSYVEVEGGLKAFVVPVIVSHSRLGYVCAFSEGDELGELERVALENAATVAAVEMARDQARFETEVRLKGDFVDDLIGGRFGSADSLMRRASFLGCDLSKGATVLVADFDEFERGIAERGMEEEEIQRLKNRFFNKCTRLVAGAEPSSLVSLKSDHVICLLSGPLGVDRQSLDRIAKQIQGLGQEVVGLSVSVGISRHVEEMEALRKALDEAMTALKVGRRLDGNSSVMHFDGAGTYRLLLSSFEQNPEELRLLYAETIKLLEEYDAESGSRLVDTLTTYLERDGN